MQGKIFSKFPKRNCSSSKSKMIYRSSSVTRLSSPLKSYLISFPR